MQTPTHGNMGIIIPRRATVPTDSSELGAPRTAVESQRGHQGKTPRPRESQVGASGRARHSAPQLPLGLVGQERNGRGRSAAVLCAGFEYKKKIRLDDRTLVVYAGSGQQETVVFVSYLPTASW